MSIAQDLRTRARHRGMKPWELIQKIGRLEREVAAKEREADNAACVMVAMATEIDELKAERNRLQEDFDRAAIDYSGALEDVRVERTEKRCLQAALSNATAVSQLPQHISTQPIPVLPLHQSPLADPASPAHVPSWADDTETQSIRTVGPAT